MVPGPKTRLTKKGDEMSVPSEVAAELLTTSQVAKLINAGERTVWRWSRSGRMPAPVRIGGAVRFRRQEILEWIGNGCPRVDGQEY